LSTQQYKLLKDVPTSRISQLINTMIII